MISRKWGFRRLGRREIIILLVLFVTICTIVTLIRIDTDLDFSSVSDDHNFVSHLFSLGNSENITITEFEWVESQEDSIQDSKEITELKSDPELLRKLQSQIAEVQQTATATLFAEIPESPVKEAAKATLMLSSVVSSSLLATQVPFAGNTIYGGADSRSESKPFAPTLNSAKPTATSTKSEDESQTTFETSTRRPLSIPPKSSTLTKPPRKAPKYGKLVNTRDGLRAVHLLMPSTIVNDLLCKSMFSAAINNYPHPIILNYKHPVRVAKEAHFLKLGAIKKYLESDDVEPEDIVLVFDAFDIWFQIDFERLIARYYKLQDEEKVRKGATYSETVIFGADKGCWPNLLTSAACTKVPNSTLPDNIYGPKTDTDTFRNRPRWLNSGTIIGPASVMRKIFNRAVLAKGNKFFSDQLVLADIWAEFDLPIIVDYQSVLFQTLTHSHYDVAFLYQDQIEEGEVITGPILDPITGGISTNGGQKNDNPLDYFDILQNTPLTLSVFRNLTRAWRQTDRHTAWNRISGNVPAVIHLNGDKSCLKTWWHKMWWVHDRGSDHQWLRLKYVRDHGGAFLDMPDETMVWSNFNSLCSTTNMFEVVKSKFDGHTVRKGERASIESEPMLVGMNPQSSPADIWDDLVRFNQKMKKAKAESNNAKQAAAAAVR